MIRKLWNGAAGMVAQSLKIDTIANNVANINTTAFKKKSTTFQDLAYRSAEGPGSPVVPRDTANLLIGQGVKAQSTRTIFTQGIPRETERELDMAIEGNGFFRIILPDGGEAFTRAGAFSLDGSLNLVTEDGYAVDLLPEELRGVPFASLSIDNTGHVRLLGEEGEVVGEGQAFLFRFPNPGGLEAMGKNLWRATDNSGEAEQGTPGVGGFGVLNQKYLEQSNVNMLEEMTRLILAQRAYEVSSRTVRTADEMWGMANQLRR